MCGRYALYGPKSRSRDDDREVSATDRALVQKLIDGLLETFTPRYNIAPQQGNPKNYVPIIRRGESGALEAVLVQWWLLPHWSKEARIRHSTFNARIETVGSLASFRESFKRRRCLIPASGWYEWQELPGGNLPWYVHPSKGDYLLFAGLWDRWERAGEVIESCSIIVGPADESVEPYRDRAPFTVADHDLAAWLDPERRDPESAMSLLKPFDHDAVASHRIDKRVNKATIDVPALIEPLAGGDG
jgi:putative SOS response-associated peptidase YedK